MCCPLHHEMHHHFLWTSFRRDVLMFFSHLALSKKNYNKNTVAVESVMVHGQFFKTILWCISRIQVDLQMLSDISWYLNVSVTVRKTWIRKWLVWLKSCWVEDFPAGHILSWVIRVFCILRNPTNLYPLKLASLYFVHIYFDLNLT